MRKDCEIIGEAESRVAFGGGGHKDSRRNKASVGLVKSEIPHSTE